MRGNNRPGRRGNGLGMRLRDGSCCFGFGAQQGRGWGLMSQVANNLAIRNTDNPVVDKTEKELVLAELSNELKQVENLAQLLRQKIESLEKN